MTAATVTKAQVAAALNEFRRQGKPQPGLHRLREVIGHGSLARIKRLRHEIELDRSEQLSPELVKKVPDPVSAAAARVWTEIEAASDDLQAAIEQNLVKAQAVMHEEVAGVRKQLTEVRKALQQAEEGRANTEQALSLAETENARRQTELAHAEETVKRLRIELTTQANEAVAREATLNGRLDQEHQRRQADAKEALRRQDYLQGQLETVRDTLGKARETHAAYAAEMEANAKALAMQLKERDTRLAALNTEHQQVLKQAQKLEKDLARAQALRDAQADEIAELRQAGKTRQKRVEELVRNLERAAAKKKPRARKSPTTGKSGKAN